MAFARRWHRRATEGPFRPNSVLPFVPLTTRRSICHEDLFVVRPKTWLAIRGHDAAAVFETLGLDLPLPSHWSDCSPGSGRMFVSVPVRGWIVVSGDGIPDPSEDVDRCFRFLLLLSGKLGHVQMFSASSVLNEHAWAKIDSLRVVRGFSWSGQTRWNQGNVTPEEQRLAMECPDYSVNGEDSDWQTRERMGNNLHKLPLLAARWSIDPVELELVPSARAAGMAGFSGCITT